MRFMYPWFLILLAFLPLWWWRLQQTRPRTLQFPEAQRLSQLVKPRWWSHPYFLPLLRGLVLVLLIFALARPQTGRSFSEVLTEGVDIILAVDTSGSMRALDLKLKGEHVTRLEVVQNVLADFVQKRLNDRIGIVVFGDEAFTQAPLTHDNEVLIDFLDQWFIGMAGESTAIGSAIAIASQRLKDLKAKSKILILLTDGENTAGKVAPKQAAEAAKELGIKIYTIGVGSRGKAPFEVDGFFGKQIVYQEVSIDEALLKEVAKMTGGQYFRATDTKDLQQIYDRIDQLETTEAKVKEYHEYEERFLWLLTPAILLFLLEVLLANSLLRRLP